MKRTNVVSLTALFAVLAARLLCACVGQEGSRPGPENPRRFTTAAVLADKQAGSIQNADSADAERIQDTLDQIAELERSGLFRPGMAAGESGLRERIGDYAGATVAAFKEMSWAYGHGYLALRDIEEGLERVIALDGQSLNDPAVLTAYALLAFLRGRWDEAEIGLMGIFDEADEPDGFVNWLLLSCALEKNPDDRKAGVLYKSIRARYVQYPEYWYRGARVFPGIIGSEFAELCINLAPNGPFADECRGILASFSGLKKEDGLSLKSKSEIEELITQAVNQGNPELLSQLMPLISLPENPYTVYAIGALKGLASQRLFRDYFDAAALRSTGRLADRLGYISRG